MTQNNSLTKTTGQKTLSHRKISLTAGILYLLTFVSIPTISLYSQAKSPEYILTSGSDTAALVGAVLEVIIAVAGIATAVVLYPILKKVSESAALGLVAARIVESSAILIGVASILSIVSLHQSASGELALVVSHALVTMYDKVFLLSQSFIPAICDMLLGFMLYKSQLVPRVLALIGIMGGPILLIGYFAIFFGAVDRQSSFAGFSALLVALFELSLGVWLTAKGFNAKAVSRLES